MTTPRTIEVELPSSLDLGDQDVELLKATFQAILSLRCESGCHWRELMQQLRDDGWQVTWGLRWQAQARRGRDSESAGGETLDQAFDQLQQLTRLDAAPLWP